MRVPGCAMCAQSDHDTCMLDRFIRIVQLGTDYADILTHCIHQKLFHPVRVNDLRIVVQKQQILSLCILYTEIVDF